MKILVIGSNGFLGSKVVDELNRYNHKLTLFDKSKIKINSKKNEIIVSDINNLKNLKKAIKGKDIVYNFAGFSDLSSSKYKARDTVNENILNLVNILDECVKNKVKKFMYASTIYVDSDMGFFYKCSKKAAEDYISEYKKIYNLNYTIFRYGSLYGPGSDYNNGLYKIIKQILKLKMIKFNGSKESQREYIHVTDAAKASVDLLDKKFNNQKIIISGQELIKTDELFSLLKEILGKNKKIVYSKKKLDGHYLKTPYILNKEIVKKYTLPFHVDFAQGLVDLINYVKKKEKLN